MKINLANSNMNNENLLSYKAINIINNGNIKKNNIINNNINISDNNSDRKVTISMDNKNFVIIINDNTTLNKFKEQSKQYFAFTNNVKIYYFNTFGVKKIISNEKDFKDSLNQKVFKYYFTEEIIENPFNVLFVNNPNVKPDNQILNENKINTKVEDNKFIIQGINNFNNNKNINNMKNDNNINNNQKLQNKFDNKINNC